MKIRKLIRFIKKKIMSKPVISILSLLVLIYLCATITIIVFEKVSFGAAAIMILPAFLGELGILESNFIITQISVMAALIVSVAFIAIITAQITTIFIEFCRRGGSIMKKVDLSDHIIIAGWNFQGEGIVRELLCSEAKSHREIVILADCEKRPVKDERIDFIKGDPTQDKDLIRAGIKRGNSVIVLSDLAKPANEADAEALMIILAVETLNREAHSCVQIVNSSNRIHFERANADEIICLDQLGGNLIVASALNHGTSQVVSELLNFNFGSEFYRYDDHLSDEFVGKEFSDAVQVLAKKHIILLGFETDDSEELRQTLSNDISHSLKEKGKIIIVNPQSQYKIRQGDALFLIAESIPTKL